MTHWEPMGSGGAGPWRKVQWSALVAGVLLVALWLVWSAGRDGSTEARDAGLGTTPTSLTDGGGDGGEQDLLAELDGLAVRSSDPSEPYRRDAFGDGWDYDPTTRCNTREEVLAAESLTPPVVDEQCRPSGRWRSIYDGATTDDRADLEIDHLVPLADAWRSGASTWTDDRRRSFANDQTSPDTLIAVTGHTNRSKGDSTPDQWLPPDQGAWCTYAQMWVGVKAAWHLSVTAPERDRLRELLASC